jgi:hypothetical protein
VQMAGLKDWRRRALLMRSRGIPIIPPVLNPDDPFSTIARVRRVPVVSGRTT